MIISIFAQANTYYISNEGNDNNDGISVTKPWKTIKFLQPGNTYFLRSGETFFFSIAHIENPLNKKIVISSFGNGSKPVISLYKKINSSAWELYAPNIWKVSLKNKNNYTGFWDNSNTDVGFIKVNGIIKGNKVAGTSFLQSQWDFYSDALSLYVYSSQNPSKLAKEIQVTTNDCIISLSDNMEISNLSLTGTGGHAIQGRSVSNVVIKSVDITEIGGSYLPGFGNGMVRYGNGIEFWKSASNCLVQYCKAENVYDVAFTMQSTEPGSLFENVTFKNNKANNNEQSFEFWVKGKGGSFKNCSFANNYCTNAGFGWSHSVRPDKQVGVHLLCYYAIDGQKDLSISDNTFIKANSGYIHLPANSYKSLLFKSSNNKIYLDTETPIIPDQTFSIQSPSAFIDYYGLEKGSSFKALK